MWYEILPSFFAFAGCASMPFIIIPSVNYLFFGKPMVRQPALDSDLPHMRRDQVLDPTGRMNTNYAVYWEGIPDAKD